MKMSTKRRYGGMEENTMAILDTYSFSKSSKHISDDRLSFLEAVRSGFLVTENAAAPTNKMFTAIFQILKVESSLDLMMLSYQLLLDLDKVLHYAWSPFSLGTDVTYSEKQEDNDKISGSVDVTYLVNVLEGDLVPRNLAFTKNSDWVSLRESLLNMILVSRKISYKELVKDCLFTMCELSQFSTKCSHDIRPAETVSTETTEKCHTALALALPKAVKCTCAAVQKLLLMIIELDSSKKAADLEGWTTRADGTRTPATEIIMDELTYDKNILFPFFQALDQPKLKLDMIIQYFKKYIPKTNVRTRRSNGGSTNDSTFGGILNSFSNENITKNILKKISSEVAQLLLAHAFQVIFCGILQEVLNRKIKLKLNYLILSL
ncbi:negative regulator of systemic acquired resistance SNI1-like [Bidens hawaiensis]|uniref:negative regulator of systemic acquired resistance SNI1-like n=1 Tax=Bidens hawaiensis TaxID=980011 RepID=UPI00404950DD